MLPRIVRTRCFASGRLFQACRIQAMCTSSNIAGTFTYIPPAQPNLVLEEDVTKLPPGMPRVIEEDIWVNQNQLLPERHELWYDDGVAQPEFYAGEKGSPTYYMNTKTAAFELAAALTVIVGGGYALASLLGDRHKHVIHWRETIPFDLRREHGLPEIGDGEEEEEEEED